MYKYFKRSFEFIGALIGLIILLPLLLIIAGTLFLNQGSVFFIQTRPGKNEKLFQIRKFKTMNDKKDKDGHLLPDEERVTKLGDFLRKTSIDEFPQLWNVLVGDMSVVGPRPLLVKYLPLYDAQQRKRHNVRPGITGWAQVNGRNAISWDQKFAYDIWYVEHESFLLDIKILWLTFLKVLKREGISTQTGSAMEFFEGNAH